MKLSGVRLSVCLFIHLSAPSFSQAPHTTAAALLLWAWRVGDVDPLLRGPVVSSSDAAAQRTAANADSATLSADVES